MLPKSSIFWFFAFLLSCDAPLYAMDQGQVQEILKRVAARAEDETIRSNRTHVHFTRQSITEELSDKGNTTSKKVQTYKVYPLVGAPYHRLVQVNDRTLPTAEQRRKEAEEKQERLDGKDKPNKRRDFQVTGDILARFSFSFEKWAEFEGRKVVVLNFKPKSPLPGADNIFERILNCLGGQLWIDSEDAEIVVADIKLLEKVTLWGGIVGNLDLFQLHVTKKRVLPGVWLNEQTFIEIGGRKLLSSTRLRIFEHCKDFQTP